MHDLRSSLLPQRSVQEKNVTSEDTGLSVITPCCFVHGNGRFDGSRLHHIHAVTNGNGYT
jgi:hypothetical protein